MPSALKSWSGGCDGTCYVWLCASAIKHAYQTFWDIGFIICFRVNFIYESPNIGCSLFFCIGPSGIYPAGDFNTNYSYTVEQPYNNVSFFLPSRRVKRYQMD